MTNNVIPFNPLDKKNLGSSVATALLRESPASLANLKRFKGAGIYALYYFGRYPVYQPLVKRNQDSEEGWPIYVGKAVPQGARKGELAFNSEASYALFKRLSDHEKSIQQARNLKIEDFKFRQIAVDDIWIPLGESLMISRFTPIWNALIDGFGNHDPGKGRHAGMMPRWDVIHPGREWAKKCQRRSESREQIESEITNFWKTQGF